MDYSRYGMKTLRLRMQRNRGLPFVRGLLVNEWEMTVLHFLPVHSPSSVSSGGKVSTGRQNATYSYFTTSVSQYLCPELTEERHASISMCRWWQQPGRPSQLGQCSPVFRSMSQQLPMAHRTRSSVHWGMTQM